MNSVRRGIGNVLSSALFAWYALLVAATAERDPGLDPRSLDDLRWIQERVKGKLEEARKAVVVVNYGGSGVIISEDGFVLTAEHVVVSPGRDVQVTLWDGTTHSGKSLGTSGFADAGLAKLDGEGPWPYVEMAESDASEAGDWCFALGHSSGWDKDRGPVLRVGRIVSKLRNVLQSDCAIIGGDSGGPLFDLEGRVIGIHSAVMSDIDENFHAPIEAFRRHWDQLKEGARIPEWEQRGGGFLGVVTTPDDRGRRVTEFLDRSRADDSGLLVGDIITHAEGYVIETAEELALVVRRRAPGNKIELTVLREGEPEVLPIELVERPRRGRSFRQRRQGDDDD